MLTVRCTLQKAQCTESKDEIDLNPPVIERVKVCRSELGVFTLKKRVNQLICLRHLAKPPASSNAPTTTILEIRTPEDMNSEPADMKSKMVDLTLKRVKQLICLRQARPPAPIYHQYILLILEIRTHQKI